MHQCGTENVLLRVHGGQRKDAPTKLRQRSLPLRGDSVQCVGVAIMPSFEGL